MWGSAVWIVFNMASFEPGSYRAKMWIGVVILNILGSEHSFCY